jgi:hypothetical protein
MLPDFDGRRGRVHDSSDTGGLAFEVRIIFLEIVCSALLFAFGRQLQLSDFGPEENPHTVQIFVFSGRQQRDQQSDFNCGHGSTTGLAVRDAFAKRGETAISKYRTVRKSCSPEIAKVGKALARIDIDSYHIAYVHFAYGHTATKQCILV